MPRVCKICNKGPQFGHNVSHANNKTRKVWLPNLQKIKADIAGKIARIYVCTRCLRSGAVKKVS